MNGRVNKIGNRVTVLEAELGGRVSVVDVQGTTDVPVGEADVGIRALGVQASRTGVQIGAVDDQPGTKDDRVGAADVGTRKLNDQLGEEDVGVGAVEVQVFAVDWVSASPSAAATSHKNDRREVPTGSRRVVE
ncbi:hypothetical protein FRC02_002373 [Tulasnella sp. 418]|nr:hypothetical protein FRC02_002373 [Tulasnella sp. 418]